jgi:AcrR family transcriptional regulator
VGTVYRYFPDRYALIDAVRPGRADARLAHARADRAEAQLLSVMAALAEGEQAARGSGSDGDILGRVGVVPARALERRLLEAQARAFEEAALHIADHLEMAPSELARALFSRADDIRSSIGGED